METALVGLLGIVIGIFLNEIIRRRSRIESFAVQVFQRRLAVYEELYALVDRAQGFANKLFEDTDLDNKQRHAIWSAIVLEVAHFADANGLYLAEDVMLHCMMMLMGIEEIPELEDEKTRSAAKREFALNVKAAREMIAQESGMTEVNKLLRKIARPTHESDLVESARLIHERYQAEGQ